MNGQGWNGRFLYSIEMKNELLHVIKKVKTSYGKIPISLCIHQQENLKYLTYCCVAEINGRFTTISHFPPEIVKEIKNLPCDNFDVIDESQYVCDAMRFDMMPGYMNAQSNRIEQHVGTFGPTPITEKSDR